METSNFRNAGNHPQAIAICLFPPRGYAGKVDKSLGPTFALFKKGHYTKQEFIEAVLKRRDPQKIYDQYKDSILICFEAPGKTCHRRYVAEWLEEKLGVTIPERKPSKESAGQYGKNPQKSLFAGSV